MKLLLLCFSLISFSTLAATAEANLTSPKMEKLSARVHFTEVPGGLKITADVSGLSPGSVHGFHVHETGKCDKPDFNTAGDHYNPDEEIHGGPAAERKHSGDLGNLVANDKGVAKTEVVVETKNKSSLRHYIGRAVIIHAKADDYTSQPSGDAGDRIACGVISRKSSGSSEDRH